MNFPIEINNYLIEIFTNGDFAVNTYLVYHKTNNKALVIDPGEDPGELLEFLQHKQLQVTQIINTHGHSDHIAGNRAIAEKFGAPIAIHRLDMPALENPAVNLSNFLGKKITSPPASSFPEESTPYSWEGLTFTVFHCPGHTPGGIALYAAPVLFAGDILFQGSVGRSDLPGGDSVLLIKSIKEKLLKLPEDTIVLPGHGPATTIEYEKQHNPFL